MSWIGPRHRHLGWARYDSMEPFFPGTLPFARLDLKALPALTALLVWFQLPKEYFVVQWEERPGMPSLFRLAHTAREWDRGTSPGSRLFVLSLVPFLIPITARTDQNHVTPSSQFCRRCSFWPQSPRPRPARNSAPGHDSTNPPFRAIRHPGPAAPDLDGYKIPQRASMAMSACGIV